MFGGNASAEGGAEEAAEDVSQSGCNIVLANRLQEETSFDKKAFQGFIKVFIVQDNEIPQSYYRCWPKGRQSEYLMPKACISM